MKDHGATVFQYAIRVLAVELVIVLVVGGILLLREHTLNSFGDWMAWAGLLSLVVGFLSVIGHGDMARSGTYQMGQTVGERDIPSRTKDDLEEERKGFSFLLLATGVGILAIILSRLL